MSNFEWTTLLGSNEPEEGHALTIGADGSIYIAGHTWGDLDRQTNNGGYGDAFLTKFNPNGTKEWTRLLGTSESDRGRALTTGSDLSLINK